MTDLDLAKIKEAAEKATPGPWDTDTIDNEDGKWRFKSYIVGSGPVDNWKAVVDTSNSDVIEIHREDDIDYSSVWDEQGRRNAEFIALARTAVPALIARLEAAEANLKWEQHRAGRIGTHSEDCHTWGPQHYECLLRKFNEAEARNATAYAEGVEAAAKAVEAYKRDASFDDSQVGALEHNSNEENIVCAIRSLLKDKPNG